MKRPREDGAAAASKQAAATAHEMEADEAAPPPWTVQRIAVASHAHACTMRMDRWPESTPTLRAQASSASSSSPRPQQVTPTQLGALVISRGRRRAAHITTKTMDMETALMDEEGLIRLVFSFLDVRDHQIVQRCSRAWRRLVQTLQVDTLDLAHGSSSALITNATWPYALRSVLRSYRSVRSVTFAGQRAVGDHDWLLLTSTFWAQLEHVRLDDCLEITDFGLLSLLNAQSQRLRSVSMRHCKRIMGDYSSTQITGVHPALESLDFTDTRVGFGFVSDLDALFPSLQYVHALHTPAHLEFFYQRAWSDLVHELQFIVDHELSDPAHLVALLKDFANRVQELTNKPAATSTNVDANAADLDAFQRTLLQYGTRALVDVPLQHGEFVSALLYACDARMPAVVRNLLVQGGASLDVTDIDGATPLCVSIHRDLPEIVQLMLQDPRVDVNKRTRNLATPLHIAAEVESADMVAMLLACGADPICFMAGGQTALCVAAKNGRKDKVAQLLAAEAGRPRRSEMVALQHVHALFLACEHGHVEIVRDLLESAHVDANALMDNTASPLYLACQMGHEAIVELLLQHGADPDFRRAQGGISCLYIAAQEGNMRVIELLLAAHVNVHAHMDDWSTALHIAARMGHADVAKALLRDGAQVNDQTRTGLTPLFIASEEGHLECVELLLLFEAAVNLQAWNGATPLFAAARNGHAAIVRALLLAGANVQLLDHTGTSPMDAASLFGNLEVTKLLLQFGARVGVMALRFAKQRHDRRMLQLLLDCFHVQHFQTLQLLPPPPSARASSSSSVQT